MIAEMRTLHETASKEDRDFNDGERQKYEALKSKVISLDARIERSLALETAELEEAARNGKPVGDAPKPKAEWRTTAGEAVQYRNAKNNLRFMERLEKKDQGLSMARAIRAMIVGDPALAPAETRAMNTTGASAAVPASVAAEIIDYAFERSSVMAAGATLLQMPTKDVTIARVTDPGALEVKAENIAFTGDVLAVDGVDLTSFTIGNVFTMSRELAQDAPNFEATVTRTISALLADAIDNFALNGAGTTEPLGLLATPHVGLIDDYGLLDGWGAILQAWAKVAGENHEVNTIMLNPPSIARLDAISMSSLQERPEVLRNIPRYISNKLAADGGIGDDESTLVVGDFSKLIVGVRAGAQVEVSAVAEDAFAKHQIMVKITWRGDIAVEQPKAFCKVTGLLLEEGED